MISILVREKLLNFLESHLLASILCTINTETDKLLISLFIRFALQVMLLVVIAK